MIRTRGTKALVCSVVATVSVLALAGCTAAGDGTADDPNPDDSGKFSSFTSKELQSAWKNSEEFPLLVPTNMPEGADATDEAGFELANIVVEPSDPAASRVWLSFYEAAALDPTDTQFRIFQRPLAKKPGVTGACGATDLPHIERTINETVLTICGLGLDGQKAHDYWKSVEFTTTYEQVPWIN